MSQLGIKLATPASKACSLTTTLNQLLYIHHFKYLTYEMLGGIISSACFLDLKPLFGVEQMKLFDRFVRFFAVKGFVFRYEKRMDSINVSWQI